MSKAKKWIIPAAIVAAVAITWGLWSARPDLIVDVVSPRVGTIEAYVEEQAVTELPQDVLVAMPIAGWLEPIILREGDAVAKGAVVARLEKDDLLDHVHQAQQRIAILETELARTKDHRLEENALVEVRATVKAIDETVKAGEAKIKASRAVWEFAETEIERVIRLAKTGAASDREVREAKTLARQTEAEYQGDRLELAALKTLAAVSYIGPKFILDYIDRKRFDVLTLERKLEQARSQLAIEKRNLARAEITSPIDGVVLARHQTRRQFLPAGTPLLTIGRLDTMEVIAEILTERAPLISPGDPVDIFGRALPGEGIRGKVLRVYPAGFKKISSLGVEQQRVKVAVKIDDRPANLGVDFRVYVRIIYDRASDALTLPRTAMFRGKDGRWRAMAVRDGITREAPLKVGLMNDERAQILDGLTAEDAVVAQPSKDVVAGLRVRIAPPQD